MKAGLASGTGVFFFLHGGSSRRFLLALSAWAVFLSPAAPAAAQSCDLCPIALSISSISNVPPNTIISNILNGAQSGNFGWLTWAGSPSVPTLVTSLTPPGDSDTYVNPDNPNDDVVSVGDWVQGKPGVSNSKQVRDALDVLKTLDITVPVWNQTRGQGANADYRVSAFARVRLLSYQLPGQNRITARFLGLTSCGANLPPVVDAGPDQVITSPSPAHLQGSVSDDGLPSGVITSQWQMISGSGTVTFACPTCLVTTATFSQPGSYVLRLTASDGALSAFDDVSVAVNSPNHPPEAAPQSVSTAEDVPLDITLAGSDPDSDPLTYRIEDYPSFGALSGTPPDVAYAPTNDYNGPDSFTFTVNDGLLDSAPATVSIAVTPVNDAPVAENIFVTNLEDTAVTVQMSGADVDGDSIAYEIVENPLYSDLGPASSNTVLLTPHANFNGNDQFLYRVTDGVLFSATAIVNVVTLPANDAPVAYDQTVTLDEDTGTGITLTGFDVDGEPLTFEMLAWPSHGSLSGEAPDFTYSPDTNFNGSDALVFRAFDGVLYSGSATVSIVVSPVNDPPEADGQSVATDEDTPANVTLAGSDVDGDGLTFEVTDPPTNGTLTGTAPDLLYTPGLNFNGNDSFSFVASDAALTSAPVSVEIAVTPVNDSPIPNPQSVTTDEDLPLGITLSATDVENDPLTFAVVDPPTNGTLTGSPPDVSYTPNADFNGQDSFTFTASDASSTSAPRVIQVAVLPVNDPPVATPQSLTTDEDTALAIVLSGSDVDGDALTFAVAIAPTNGALSGTPPHLTYTPNANFNGVDSFTFTANDGIVDSTPVIIQIDVNPVNDAPAATPQTLTTDEDVPLQVVLAGSDVDGDSLDFLVVVAPTNGQLSGTPPNLTYTPNPNFNGVDSFFFTASDFSLTSAPSVVQISVAPVNDAPVADAQSLGTDEDVALPIALSGSDVDGDALSFAVVEGPNHGVLSGTAPNLIYQPFTNFNGNDSFSFVASDMALTSEPAVVQITVAPVNDAPIAQAQSITTFEDAVIPLALYAYDADRDPLAYTIIRAPTNGALYGQPPFMTYWPSGEVSGVDSLLFKVNDGTTDSAPAEIIITILPVNDPCYAVGQIVTNQEDTPLPITLQGFDPDQDPLSFTIETGPAHGTLSGTPPDLVYTPAPEFSGQDSFTFRVSDGQYLSEPAPVVIIVEPVNDAPVVTATGPSLVTIPALAVLEGSSADADGPAALTSQWTVVNGPGLVTFGTATALTTTASFAQSGVYTLHLTAGDSLALSFADVTVTANAPPSVNAGPDQGYVGVQAVTVSGAVSDDGLPGGVLTTQWSRVSGPGNAIIANPSALTSTVTFTNVGAYVLRLTGSDGVSTNSDDVSIMFNTAPVVSAGPDIRLDATSTVAVLNGTITDDGLPSNWVGQVQWRKLAGPGAVVFGNATQAATTATFGTNGVYALELSASDGLLQGRDVVDVRVASLCSVKMPQDIVAWWSGNGTTNEEIGGRNATLLNGAGITNGLVSGAFSFDGVNDLAFVPAHASLNIGTNAGWSIEFWARPSAAAYGGMFGWGVATNAGLYVNNASGSYVVWHLVDVAGTDHPVSTTIQLAGGTWTHVGLTYDRLAGVARVYRNGVLMQTVGLGSFVVRTDRDLHWGGMPGVGYFFAGALDEISLYRRVLSPEEMNEIYVADGIGKCPQEANQAPVVDAGPDLVAGSPMDLVNLLGSAADDGLPAGLLRVIWGKLSGPGTVTFGSSNSAASTASFSAAGFYVLKLTADDGSITRSDVTEVRVGQPCSFETADLAAWWPGNGTPDEVAGGAQVRLWNGATYTAGQVGMAFLCDGTNDLAYVPAQPSLNIGTNTGWTIEFWAQPLWLPYGGMIGWGTATNVGVYVNNANGSYVTWHLVDVGGTDHSVGGGIQLTPGTWTHLGLTYDRLAGVARVYRNGLLVQATTLGSFVARTDSDFYWGGMIGVANYYGGALDEISLYRRALDAEEMYALYQADGIGKCPQDANQAPVVNAGPDIALESATNVANLLGSVTDDGLPAGVLRMSWTKLSGPGTVAFGSSNSAASAASFSAAGFYVLRLTADDGSIIRSDVMEARVGLTCSYGADGLAAWWTGNGESEDSIAGLKACFWGGATYTTGQVGMAFSCDGTNDLVSAAAHPSLNIGTNAGWSIEFWARPLASPYGGMFGWGSATAPGVYAFNASGSYLVWHLVDVAGTDHPVSTTIQLAGGTWTHLGLTYDRLAGVARVYRNGLLVQTTTLGSFVAKMTNDLYWGGMPGINYFFGGALDEIGLYRRALDPQEMYEIYVADGIGKCPQDANLAPVVDAGPDIALESATNVANLLGSVTDDGLPAGVLRMGWSQLSGPGAVTFGSSNLAASTASFSSPGLYVLKLTADDGSIIRSDVMEVRAGWTCAIQSEDLVAWWPGNGEPKDVIGGLEARLWNGATYTTGQVGLAFSSDGTNDLFCVPANPGLNVGTNAGWTIEFWTRPLWAAYGGMFGWGTATAPGLYAYNRGSSYVDWHLVDVGGTDHSIQTSVYMPPGAWTHLGLTYDRTAGVARVYRNGVLIHTVSVGSFVAKMTNDLYWGGMPGFTYSFGGALDEISLYSRALSSQEVAVIYASDGFGKCPHVANHRPFVNAGEDQHVTATNTILAGTVIDDGLPTGSVIQVVWAQTAGPATARILQPGETETAVNFPAYGDYAFRLDASDGERIGHDDVAVSVRPGAANQAPIISAGPDQTVAFVSNIALEGSVADDGLPWGAVISSEWSQVSGPSAATFDNRHSAIGNVQFDLPGTYVLRLTASDGELAADDEVSITIYPANLPPVVNAGPDQTIAGPVATLSGSITDDGRPSGVLTAEWTQVSGPADSAIGNRQSAVTTVSLSKAGTYVLRLTGGDGQFSVSDEVSIVLTGDQNQTPVVEAGPDQSVDLMVPTPRSFWTNAWLTAPRLPDHWIYDLAQPGLEGGVSGFGYCQGDAEWAVAMDIDRANGDLYVAGAFQTAGGEDVWSVARWDGCSWSPLKDPDLVYGGGYEYLSGFLTGSYVADAKLFGGQLYVIGAYMNHSDTIPSWNIGSRWNGEHWLAWPGFIQTWGLRDTCIGVGSNGIYLGGCFAFQPVIPTNYWFERLTNVPVSYSIARWDGTNWYALGEGLKCIVSDPEADTNVLMEWAHAGDVYGIAVAPNGDVYAGGYFRVQAVNGIANNIARWDGTNWWALGSGIDPCVGGGVAALALGPNGDVFAGGGFNSAGGQPAINVARWDGTNWYSVGGGLNSSVRVLSFVGDRLYAGGYFAGAIGRTNGFGRAAVWDGTQWQAVGSGSNPGFDDSGHWYGSPSVADIIGDSSGVYFAGNFRRAGGQAAANIVKWGTTEPPSLRVPDPITVSNAPVAGVTLVITAEVRYVCNQSLSLDWNVDGGSSEQTSTIPPGPQATSAFVTFTNHYLPGLHSVVITLDAGLDEPISCTVPVNILSPCSLVLNGSVTDDGLPVGLTNALWTQVSGPGPAVFDDPTSAVTGVRLFSVGTYILRLTGSDTALSAMDDVTVVVRPLAASNQVPTAHAGDDLTIRFPAVSSVGLTGYATDDSRPAGVLLYSWGLVSGPAPVTMGLTNSQHLSVWFSQPGTYVFRFTADDTEYVGSDDVTVTVVAFTNHAPVVNAGSDKWAMFPDPSEVEAGEAVPLVYVAMDGTVSDDGMPSGMLTERWSYYGGPRNVLFKYWNGVHTAVFVAPGTYTLRFTASDGELESNDFITVTISPYIAPPTVEIASPTNSARVTAPTPVIGTADSSLLASWILEYRSAPPSSIPHSPFPIWSVLATGSTPIVNAELATLDPTLMLNGTYELRLTATDVAGRTTESEIETIVVDGNMKVGLFTLSFDDLSVPLAGIPIQVIRTYDSRNAMAGKVGDFGVGWTMSLKDVRLQKNRPFSFNWRQEITGFVLGSIPRFEMTPIRDRIVTITLADNQVYRFRAAFSPSAQTGVPIISGRVVFEPLPGTYGTLAVEGENAPRVIGEVPYYDPLGGPSLFSGVVDLIQETGEDFEPPLFRLTTKDGTAYIVDETGGLQKVIDLNSNEVQYTSSGIYHSSGQSVQFTRDAQGRITQIVDPAGNALTYGYDTNGNLRTFTDRTTNTTTMSYLSDGSDRSHLLQDIFDPRGIRAVRSEYDESGRLIRQTDADGNPIVFSHDVENRRETITDRLGNVTVHEYDEDGNVVRTVDALSNVTTRTYDDFDNELTVTDPLGHTTTNSYDERGNKTSETDPLGNTTFTTYNTLSQPTSITDPKGNTTRFFYDAFGNLTSNVDAAGNATVFTYDSRGNQLTQVDPLGNVTSNECDSLGRLIRGTDARGVTTTFTYDVNGNQTSRSVGRTTPSGPETVTTSNIYDSANRLIKVINPDGSFTETEYDQNGKEIARIDELGRRTEMTYDDRGNLTLTTYPDGTTEGTGYDAEGRKIAQTNQAGFVTLLEYDALGRHVAAIHPDGAIEETIYDAGGRVVETINARGNSTTHGYDATGRRTATTNALGDVSAFEYDEAGNLVATTDARGNTTEYVNDALNRRTQVVFPDDTTQITAFDALGRRVTETDQAGVTTTFGYDPEGRLVAVTNAIGGVTRYEYDELGNQTEQIDANGHVTRFEYDARSRRTRRILPAGQTETMAYDPVGNLTNKVDFNGLSITYEYDPMNRLTGKGPSTIDHQPLAIRFSYDPCGLRATMSDPSGTTAYEYDERGRMVEKATPIGTLSYSYDLAGNLTTTRSSNVNGTRLSYSYDQLDRVRTVRDRNGLTAYHYDEAGNLRDFILPNGVNQVYDYNPLNRLTNLTVNSLTTPIESYRYTLGSSGHRLAVQEGNGRQVTYQYDNLYRLTRETILGASPLGDISYGFDLVGNRLAMTSTVFGIPSQVNTFDDNDRLGSDSYDSNGNTTGATIHDSLSGTDTAFTYAYDFENRIISATSAASVVQLTYDGDGNRIEKTVTDAFGTRTTRYLVDQNNLTGYSQVLEELDASNIVAVAFTVGLDLVSQTRITPTNELTHYFGTDGHGNTRFLTDEAGNITDRYDFDAWGNLIATSGTTPNNFLYCGEYRDPDLGLYFLRARYLDVGRGRVWTMDSFEGIRTDPLTLHKYLCTKADPVNLIDPSGHMVLWEPMHSIVIMGMYARIATPAIPRSTPQGTLAMVVVADTSVGSPAAIGPFQKRFEDLLRMNGARITLAVTLRGDIKVEAPTDEWVEDEPMGNHPGHKSLMDALAKVPTDGGVGILLTTKPIVAIARGTFQRINAGGIGYWSLHRTLLNINSHPEALAHEVGHAVGDRRELLRDQDKRNVMYLWDDPGKEYMDVIYLNHFKDDLK